MQILRTNHSVERRIGSPSALLLHAHVHCTQERLGEGLEGVASLLNHQTRDILTSSLAPWQWAWERRQGAGESSKGAAALAVESSWCPTSRIVHIWL